MRQEPTAREEEAKLLEALREQLAAPERRRIRALEEELLDPDKIIERGSEYLPRVVKASADKDKRLAWALQPTLEESIRHTVRERREEFAEAIYPVIGPSISRAIKSAIAEMLQRVNDALSTGLSVRHLKWRLEAYRSHRPYAEIVLVRTLVYRVEEALLVERKSGLLLAHASRPGASEEREPAMLSSLLSALHTFSAEALGTSVGLQRIEAGDRSLFVESGSQTLLAVVVRGTPPPSLAQRVHDTLERIQLDFAEPLDDFAGDVAPFERAVPLLEACLTEERRTVAKGSKRRMAAMVFGGQLLLLTVLLLLYLWAGQQFSRRVDALKAEPGYVVTSAHRASGPDRVEGLRDPLARTPEDVLRSRGMDPRHIRPRFAPYQSLDPVIVERRARAEAEKVARSLSSRTQTFPLGSAEVSSPFAAVAGDQARAFLSAARRAGADASIRVSGSADPVGAPERNAALARARAENMRDALVDQGVPKEQLEVSADGAAGRREVRLEGVLTEVRQ